MKRDGYFGALRPLRVLAVILALSSPLAAQVNFDGALGFDTEWASAKLSLVQTNYAGFGDQLAGGFSGGSEIDQLFVTGSAETLYLGITGNAERNGNSILIFLDTTDGGHNVLSGVNTLGGAIAGMNGNTLEPGFTADYVLAVNVSATNDVNVDWYNLNVSPPTHTYLGKVPANTGAHALTGGTDLSIQLAFDDTNTVGVTGTNADDAASATTGIEAAIPFTQLGIAGLPSTIRVQAVVSGNTGFLSNQSLPSLTFGTGNLGFGPVDFTSRDGVQMAEVNLPGTPWPGVLDGKAIPTDFANALVATQLNSTGFGDQQGGGLTSGSELDHLVAQDTTDALQIGVSGNLSPNGQRFVLFLDTLPNSGESLLADNPDDLAGMNGDTLPCQADYAVVANVFAGTLYVNLFDLNANTNTYLGNDPADGTGDGLLQGGAGADWIFILKNSNVLGVDADPAHDPQTANAMTATTGFEISIPLSAIGTPGNGEMVGLLAMVVGENGDRYVSNQILPALAGGGQANLGTNVDFAALGYSCATVQVGTPPLVCPTPRFDTDGDHDVDQEDFAVFQQCYTGNIAPASLPDACKCLDWSVTGTSDGAINQADYLVFQRCASGPAIAADAGCDHPPE